MAIQSTVGTLNKCRGGGELDGQVERFVEIGNELPRQCIASLWTSEYDPLDPIAVVYMVDKGRLTQRAMRRALTFGCFWLDWERHHLCHWQRMKVCGVVRSLLFSVLDQTRVLAGYSSSQDCSHTP